MSNHSLSESFKEFGNIHDIVHEANGGEIDGMAWGRRRKADTGKDRNEDARKDDNITAKDDSIKDDTKIKDEAKVQKETAVKDTEEKGTEGKKAKTPQTNENAEKTVKGKKTAKPTPKPARSNQKVLPQPPQGSIPDWNTFLEAMRQRRGMKDKALNRAVYLPDYIIDSYQSFLGRHTSDALCVLSEWFLTANRTNILKFISERSGIL